MREPYEYYRGSALKANRWDANRLNQKKPNIVDNCFGGSLSGHFLPNVWKTFFYANFEERRQSDANFFTRLVPTSTLRQGTLRFADSALESILKLDRAERQEEPAPDLEPTDRPA